MSLSGLSRLKNKWITRSKWLPSVWNVFKWAGEFFLFHLSMEFVSFYFLLFSRRVRRFAVPSNFQMTRTLFSVSHVRGTCSVIMWQFLCTVNARSHFAHLFSHNEGVHAFIKYGMQNVYACQFSANTNPMNCHGVECSGNEFTQLMLYWESYVVCVCVGGTSQRSRIHVMVSVVVIKFFSSSNFMWINLSSCSVKKRPIRWQWFFEVIFHQLNRQSNDFNWNVFDIWHYFITLYDSNLFLDSLSIRSAIDYNNFASLNEKYFRE